MKFRYYIVPVFSGSPEGTNDIVIAEQFALSEDYLVIEAEIGKWITSTGYIDIEELK